MALVCIESFQDRRIDLYTDHVNIHIFKSVSVSLSKLKYLNVYFFSARADNCQQSSADGPGFRPHHEGFRR